MDPLPQASQRNLFVVTPSNIQFRTQYTTSTLFESDAPHGILNARAAKDNSSVLAIADDHLVLLYDSDRSGDKRYRLKSGDGEPRLLLFSPDSRTLYFTTSLSHSIQAYSISTAKLLPPLQPHPSPPNVLAMSKSGKVLLSASASPPVVHIQDLRLPGTAPLSFFPTHAKLPVACAAFHEPKDADTSPYCLFLLGYQDGTLSVYRLAMPPIPCGSISASQLSERSYPQALQLRRPIRMGSMKKVHKPAMGGIRAAEFIPGFQARVVSIGHDGKCRIVDFAQGAETLRTWRVSGQPTGLSIASSGPIHSEGRKQRDVILSGDGSHEGEGTERGVEVLIAIGTQDGAVFVYDILGLLVREVPVGAPVLTLEWVGDMSAPSVMPNRRALEVMSPMPTSPVSSSQPILEILMDEYARANPDEETGTVHRTSPPLRHSIANSPVPVSPPVDLFSTPAPKRSASSRYSFSSPAHESPSSLGARAMKRRKSTRPRIVTETFSPPPSSSIYSSQRSYTSPVVLPTQDVRRWSQVRDAPDGLTMSGTLENNSERFFSFEHQDHEDEPRSLESEMFVTPPMGASRTSIQKSSPRRSIDIEPPAKNPKRFAAAPSYMSNSTPSSHKRSVTMPGSAIASPPQSEIVIESPLVRSKRSSIAVSSPASNPKHSVAVSRSAITSPMRTPSPFVTPDIRSSSPTQPFPTFESPTPHRVSFSSEPAGNLSPKPLDGSADKPTPHLSSIVRSSLPPLTPSPDSPVSPSSPPTPRQSRSPFVQHGLKRASTAKERVRDMRQYLRSRREEKEVQQRAITPRSNMECENRKDDNDLRRENERLRKEMEELRQEFWALREAVLVSRPKAW